MNIVCEVDSSTVYVRSDSKDPDQSAATLVRRTDLTVTTPDVASQVDALVTLKAKVSCAKTVVAKGTIGRVLSVHGGHLYLWMSVTQNKDQIGDSALRVERKNVRALSGCIPRRWEVAADFASHVTELLLGALPLPTHRCHAPYRFV